jgi:hypothetical protein
MHQDTSDSNPPTFSKHDKNVRPTLNICFYIHNVYGSSSLNQHTRKYEYLSYNTCSFYQQFSVCRKLLQKVMRPASSWYILTARCHIFATLSSISKTSHCMIRSSNFDRNTLLPHAPTCSRDLAMSRLLVVSTAMSVMLTTTSLQCLG